MHCKQENQWANKTRKLICRKKEIKIISTNIEVEKEREEDFYKGK